VAASARIHQTGLVTRPLHLDDQSKEIIALLQQDGRMSYATIAKQVGLSEAAVRQRAQRLMEQGVMQIVAVTDPLQLGFAWEVMIGVRVTGNVKAVADALGEIDAIDFIVLTGGKFDIILEVVAESDQKLITLTDKIRGIPGVVGCETLVYLSTRKQAYSWGVR
jgi:Lrp/AsnC family transcriptional regulator, regulator for asnA, asnC and gidA